MVEARGKRTLFDVSPDVLTQLGREGVRMVDVMFITHGHADSIGGVYDLVRLMSKQRHKSTLYVERETWEQFSEVSRHVKPWVAVKYLTPGVSVQACGTRVTPFRVPHSMTEGFPTLGFRIGKDLAYVSDASSVPKNVAPYLREVKHCILDGCMWFGKKIASHMTVDKTLTTARRLQVEHLYITQISHTYPSYTEAWWKIRAFCNKQKITIPVTLAYDGYTFTV